MLDVHYLEPRPRSPPESFAMRSALAALAPLVALVAGLGTFATTYTDSKPEQPAVATPKPRAKLAVLVVFDQMRGDYLEKWHYLFGPGGFARLVTEGAWFTRCYYPYGVTTTGPGHASILSGTCPDRHGIVNNDWYENHQEVYCAGSERYQFVPPAAPPKPGEKPRQVGTPEQMLCETLADVLKRETAGKVFGISLKDRSAILPAGKQPDGAFWFTDQFITSTYYPNDPPQWVRDFNKSKFAAKWFGTTWDRFRKDIDYVPLSGLDDVRGESGGATQEVDKKVVWRQGRTFPHPMNPPTDKLPSGTYYGALANSPFGNDVVLEFAKRCIVAEQLGQDESPDLLVVSFSSNDLIGHAWGPDSQEVLDVTLRSDALMAEFLTFLDKKVGHGNYVLALTADHGVCPLPEVAATSHPAGRVSSIKLGQDVEKYLATRFGAPKLIEKFSPPWYYLNAAALAKSGHTREEVSRALAEYLATRSEVARAFTADELLHASPADEVATRMRRSYYPARCGDVCTVLRPYFIFGEGETGTTHGAPWGYDTHVPLLVMGPGVKGGPHLEPTTPQATAAIFAKFLGVNPPRCAEFPVPATLSGN
jgi:predicted AlkP superfamily pyrophosphatase or phosphodiesterase